MVKIVLLVTLIILSLCMMAVLIRAVLGPRFTDRVVAINAVNTLIIACVCVLTVFLEEDYLADIALIYALLGFLVNTLLMRQLIAKRKEEKKS